jgi:hypothetical protein
MKKLKKTCMSLAFILSAVIMSFSAKASVVLNSTNFPDANFRAYVASLTNVAEGDTITDDVINSIDFIDCGSNNISSIDGIEYFTALTWLMCSNNGLTTLDVSKFVNLEILECNDNNLTTIDLSKNINLKRLICSTNQLTSLDLSKNINLVEFDCSNNVDFSSIDVSKNTNLKIFNCIGNNLSSLDVSNNINLTQLDCNTNWLTSIDLSKNVNLTDFSCFGNMLTSLDVSKNVLLKSLQFNDNKINSIDLSNNPKLTTFNNVRNGRSIWAYSYERGPNYKGTVKTGYYLPLQDQTDGMFPTSSLATLIDQAGQPDDKAFDLSKVVDGSWSGVTLGEYKGTPVLFLDESNPRITYNYNTGFTGTASTWTTDNSAVSPNVSFYIDWSAGEISTGVDGVSVKTVNVYATNGTINVSNVGSATVDVYDLSGRQVYGGNSSEITVPAGMYVVKVDGAVHKVLVK